MGARILLADDSVLFAMMLQEELEAAGHEVTSFGSGARALDWLRSEAPDAVILDVALQDGACRTLAAELLRREIPFLVVSGHARSTSQLAELERAPWFEKPVDAPVLLAALAKYLASRAGGTRRA